jgi:hypothetical protein
MTPNKHPYLAAQLMQKLMPNLLSFLMPFLVFIYNVVPDVSS